MTNSGGGKKGKATPRKKDGKVPPNAKKENPTSKASGKKGAAKAKAQGHNKPGQKNTRKK